MRRYVWELVAVVVLALGGAYAAHSRRADADAAKASLTSALAYNTRQNEIIGFLTTRASAAEARADAADATADSLAKASRRSEIRYVQAKATAPDTCDAVLAEADHALLDAQDEAEAARAAFRAAQDAANAYRAGKDSALAANARLRAAGEDVVASSRPSLLERVRPRITAGITTGYNPLTARPAVVVGVGLGWSF